MAACPAQLTHHAAQQSHLSLIGLGAKQQLAQFGHPSGGGMGIEKAHLQQQLFGVLKGGLQSGVGWQGAGFFAG